jgi:hypothetical protein
VRADPAFEHYQQGNLCKRQSPELWPGFDIEAVRREVDEAIATFNRDFFARLAPLGHPSAVPVFIVGMPRSGTTLIEQVLASHRHFAGAGELPDIAYTANDLAVSIQGEKYPACLAHLTRDTTLAMADRYLKRLQRDNASALRVSDKMPLNCFHLGLIAVLFPRARVIHCRRNPLDTCVSCFCENFESLPFTSSLEDLGQFYREYARLMAHWQQVLPLAMFDLHYEDLVAGPEPITRELLSFCGLDWDERCAHFHQTQRPVLTASNLQVRQPVYTRSVGRWQRYQSHLGPLLVLLKPHSPKAAA